MIGEVACNTTGWEQRGGAAPNIQLDLRTAHCPEEDGSRQKGSSVVLVVKGSIVAENIFKGDLRPEGIQSDVEKFVNTGRDCY